LSARTPGPWEYVVDLMGRHAGAFAVSASDGMVVCQRAAYPERLEEMRGNARLIAAAPDLLEAHEDSRSSPEFLNWVADRLVNVHGENPNVDYVLALRRRAAKARAAIDKAEGKS
jgi:hypothetical protein